MKERNGFIKLNKDFIKLKLLLYERHGQENKKKSTNRKNVCKDKYDKELFCKICKEFSKLNKKYLILKWIQNFNRLLTKEDVFIANKHFKRCSTSHVIRKMEIKTAEYHYTPFQIAKIENTDIIC